MKRIPVCRKELGLKLLHHVPRAYTLCQRELCVVEIEEGEEALYPLAEEWMVVPRAEDGARYGNPAMLNASETRFVPQPHISQQLPSTEVVVCPRRREYGAEKNWAGWPELVHALHGRGLSVFAAGAPDSSYRVECGRAWNYSRFLDVSIQAMLAARLVIATDAGLAHLAVLCGRPLLLITYRDLVAPGPVIDSRGRVARERYWKAGYGPDEKQDRFQAANHTGSPIWRVNGWEHIDRVISAVDRICKGQSP